MRDNEGNRGHRGDDPESADVAKSRDVVPAGLATGDMVGELLASIDADLRSLVRQYLMAFDRLQEEVGRIIGSGDAFRTRVAKHPRGQLFRAARLYVLAIEEHAPDIVRLARETMRDAACE